MGQQKHLIDGICLQKLRFVMLVMNVVCKEFCNIDRGYGVHEQLIFKINKM